MLSLPRKHDRERHTTPGGYIRRAALLAVIAATGLLAGQGEEAHHVTAVRFWSLGDVTRIAVETDGDFRARSDRLHSPERVFFDLVGTAPALGKALTVIPVSDQFVRQIRVAETQHGITRVVLDMEGSGAEITTSRLENPFRLMIEVRVPGQSAAAHPEHREFKPPVSESQPDSRTAKETPAQMETPPAVQSRTPASAVAANLSPRMTAEPPPAPVAVPVKVTSAPAATATSSGPVPAETALPAKRNASGDRSMIRVLGLKIGRIVIDAGHGGHDTGTIGPNGLREKDLVLDVARRLGKLVEERMGSEVIYTRTDDTFIPLDRRTQVANDAKADLFLSIHANSSPLASASGVETYYLNFTTSRSALEVAARENAGSQKSIFELQDLLQKIALKDKVEESREFASRIEAALYPVSARANQRAKDRGVKKAPFVVLIGASMPSVLAEIGFISNEHDENNMKRAEYRQRIAEALYKGLSGYASTLSHFQVAQRE